MKANGTERTATFCDTSSSLLLTILYIKPNPLRRRIQLLALSPPSFDCVVCIYDMKYRYNPIRSVDNSTVDTKWCWQQHRRFCTHSVTVFCGPMRRYLWLGCFFFVRRPVSNVALTFAGVLFGWHRKCVYIYTYMGILLSPKRAKHKEKN